MILCLLLQLAYGDPSASLVQPVPRENTPSGLMSHPPCSNIPKGKSHMLAEPGSLVPITWVVHSESPKANCSFRIAYSDFSNFHTIWPTDKSADERGFFACTRTPNSTEHKVFEFPEMICDLCTLQWVWETQEGTVYQCSDLEISGRLESPCFEKCQNGGVCTDNQCLCPKGYYGEYCEKQVEEEEHVHFFTVFMVLVVLLVVTGLLGFLVYYQAQHWQIPRTEELFLKRYMPWCLANRDPSVARIDQNQEVSSERRYWQNVEGGEHARV